MFVSTFKKAHDVVDDVATEAAFGLACIFLACGAFLFAAAGAAIWLSAIIPMYAALFIISAVTALVAAIVYYVGHHESTPAKPTKANADDGASPLMSLIKSVSSMGAPLDIVASGLFARQLKKSPMATLAATAAVGALVSMMADAAMDDD